MKEFTATFTKTTTETTSVTVEAENIDEAVVLLDAKKNDLNKRIKDEDVTDNLELDNEEWDWDDIECVINCDEDEEEEG